MIEFEGIIIVFMDSASDGEIQRAPIVVRKVYCESGYASDL
jgi:hypothetical protein